jgi:hypothetical protein
MGAARSSSLPAAGASPDMGMELTSYRMKKLQNWTQLRYQDFDFIFASYFKLQQPMESAWG